MKASNVRDYVLKMSIHEQLRMLRNIIEDEEFKLAEKQKQKKALKQVLVVADENEEQQQPMETGKSKKIDDMTYEELVN